MNNREKLLDAISYLTEEECRILLEKEFDKDYRTCYTCTHRAVDTNQEPCYSCRDHSNHVEYKKRRKRDDYNRRLNQGSNHR